MKLAKSSPLVLLGLGAVLVVLVGAVLFAIGDSRDAATPALRDAPSSESQVRNALLVSESEPEVVERDREPAVAASVESAAPDEVGIEHLHISGTIVLVGRDGLERRDAHGHMYLTFDYGHGERHVPVKIIGGSWSAEFERVAGDFYIQSESDDPQYATHFADGFRNSVISATSVALDNAKAITAVQPIRRFAFGDEEAEVRLRLLEPLRIEVVDANSGAHLNQVTIMVASWQTGYGPVHPGGDNREYIGSDLASPIDIAPEPRWSARNGLECLVGAPGYAWKKFSVKLATSEPQTVTLNKGGELEVSHSPPMPEGLYTIGLYQQGLLEPIAKHHLQETGKVLFTGLLPGEYDLRIELSSQHPEQGPLCMASGTAQVIAGQRAQVTLEYLSSGTSQQAYVSGQLVLPSAWRLEQFTVRFKPIAGRALLAATRGQAQLRKFFSDARDSPSNMIHDASPPAVLLPAELDQDAFVRNLDSKDTFDFDLGSIATGTYEMTLRELGSKTIFDVGPTGRSDVLLAVPEPVWITVFVRDALTGEAVDVPGVRWAAHPGGSTGESEPLVDSGATGASQFQLQVPRATLNLWSTQTRRYPIGRNQAQAESGLQVIIEVHPSSTLEVMLQTNGTAIMWPNHAGARAVQLDGHEQVKASSPTERGRRFVIPNPGRYLIVPPELEGFHPHPPVTVEISEGESQELIIQLEPDTP